MAYRIAGTYIGACDCQLLCACPVDGPPTGENGTCKSLAAFAIREGNLEGTDLSGVDFALWIRLPSNLSAGNMTLGLVVDEGASEEQAKAIEQIVSGQEGGPFGDIAPLMSAYRDTQRASVSISEGRASVGGIGDISFEPARGPDGSPTTVSNAPFGFAPTFRIGRASGRVNSPAGAFDSVYGDSAEYEYVSE